jgi:ribose transport system ATP-binding protein
MTDVPLLRIKGLTKTFGGQVALDSVDMSIQPGEVHGLLGENGSGKSTLIKVLSGFHDPDAGELTVNGSQVNLPLLPGQYRQLGFSFVHQDLGLVADLSATENLYMGKIAASHRKFFSWRAASVRAQKVFDDYDAAIDAGQVVERLRPVQRAMLAIIRAVEGLKDREESQSGQHRPNLLVLDEPTVFLPRHEVNTLFNLVRGITARGSSVLFVSHDLDEVTQITDSVTVLRDGRSMGTHTTKAVTKRDLVKLIVGHDLKRAETAANQADERRPVVLSVQGLTTGLARDLHFDLHAGEILGFAGLVGSGYEDAVYALFGSDRMASGTFTMGGATFDLAKHTTHAAVAHGLALVPADRKREGSVADLSVAENMNLTVLDRYFSGGRLRHGTLRENARNLLKEFDVRPAIPTMEYGKLSGGNQQKAMMAKWQQTHPRVLLLHEPTQGVDVGAREQIYALIRNQLSTTTVLCASSDYEELATLCHRVAIIVRGRLVGYLSGSDVTHSRIADMCMGYEDEGSASAAAAALLGNTPREGE